MLPRLLDWLEAHAAAWVAVVLVVVAIGGAALWVQQASVWVAGSEAQANAQATRAVAAEARALAAEASLTAIAQSAIAQRTAVSATRVAAVATATAVVQATDPAAALRAALQTVFEAYQSPTTQNVNAILAHVGSDAMPVFRPELDRLQAAGLTLAGDSRFDVEIVSVDRPAEDRAEIRTRETWVYDERNRAGERDRCVRERSEQVYLLGRTVSGWVIDAVQPIAVNREAC